MDTLFATEIARLSRRSFLTLAGTSLLGLFWLPLLDAGTRVLPSEQAPDVSTLGRVLNNRATLRDKPSFNAKILKPYHIDLILSVTGVTLGEDNTDYNRIWYEIENGAGYIYSGHVQPVEVHQNEVLRAIPENGRLAEVTVPYTDARWYPLATARVAYRLYYSTTHWVFAIEQDKEGKYWYQLHDDKKGFMYYVLANHLRIIPPEDVAPLSPNVPPEEKRLEIRLKDQVVVAYEADRPVFMTRAATGAHFSDGDYRTGTGSFLTNRKRPSRHMAAGEPGIGTGFDLPGVPWVSYLTKSGVSLHGTYWHNDFGRPRSHGCINLSSKAARWVYRWTHPVVPYGMELVEGETGTEVKIF
jgi:hypothetical protein